MSTDPSRGGPRSPRKPAVKYDGDGPGWLAIFLHDYALTVVLWIFSSQYRKFQRRIAAQGHPSRRWTRYRDHQRRVGVQTRRLYPNGRPAEHPGHR